MIIYFDSMTGNTQRFVQKVLQERPEWMAVKVTEVTEISEDGHLLTYTIGIGNIPLSTTQFMKINKTKILSVSSTGNRNWGIHYGEAADKIAKHYKIPMLMKLELAGTKKDVSEFIQLLENFSN